MNLDARKAVTLPAAAPLIDFADATTYNNATSLTVYDDKGQDVAMTFYFQKAANDPWNVYATANGSTIGGVRRRAAADHQPSPSTATAARRSRRRHRWPSTCRPR